MESQARFTRDSFPPYFIVKVRNGLSAISGQLFTLILIPESIPYQVRDRVQDRLSPLKGEETGKGGDLIIVQVKIPLGPPSKGERYTKDGHQLFRRGYNSTNVLILSRGDVSK